MLRVSVKLLDKKEKIHVGKVMVMKLTTQYSRLGMIVNTPSSRPPSMPVVDWAPSGTEEVALAASEVTVSVNMEGTAPEPSTDEASMIDFSPLTLTWRATADSCFAVCRPIKRSTCLLHRTVDLCKPEFMPEASIG